MNLRHLSNVRKNLVCSSRWINSYFISYFTHFVKPKILLRQRTYIFQNCPAFVLNHYFTFSWCKYTVLLSVLLNYFVKSFCYFKDTNFVLIRKTFLVKFSNFFLFSVCFLYFVLTYN